VTTQAVTTAGRLALAVLAGLAGIVGGYAVTEALDGPDRATVSEIDLDDLPPVTADPDDEPAGTPASGDDVVPPPVLTPSSVAPTPPSPTNRPAPTPAPADDDDDDRDDDDGDDDRDDDDGDDGDDD